MIVTRAAAGNGGSAAWLMPLGALAILAVTSLYVVPRLARQVLGPKLHTMPEKALFVLTMLLVLSVLAELIGTEDILGAFLAGVCLNRALHRRDELRRNVEFVGRMLFIPFFFVETGMRLELAVFADGGSLWLLAAALIVTVLAGKSAAAWVTGRLFGYPRLDRLAMAGLSFPQAAATLAVVVIGLELGMVSRETADAIIIVIFVTCLVGALLAEAAARRIRARMKPSF